MNENLPPLRIEELQLSQEINKLIGAVDAFAAEMKARLIEKAKKGYKGWDKPDVLDLIRRKFNEHSVLLLFGNKDEAKRHAVDTANLAMMLWYQDKDLTKGE